jgi:hypothetical protein
MTYVLACKVRPPTVGLARFGARAVASSSEAISKIISGVSVGRGTDVRIFVEK